MLAPNQLPMGILDLSLTSLAEQQGRKVFPSYLPEVETPDRCHERLPVANLPLKITFPNL